MPPRPSTRANASGGDVPPVVGSSDNSSTPIVALDALTAQQVGAALAGSVELFAPFVAAWASSPLSGKYLLSVTPARVRSDLVSSFQGMSDRYRAAAFEWIRSRVMSEHQRSAASYDDDSVSLWSNATFVPLVRALPLGNPQQVHGGGGIPPQIHGGGVNQMLPPPVPLFVQQHNPWSTPVSPSNRPERFAFGRKDLASPQSLMGLLNTPSLSNFQGATLTSAQPPGLTSPLYPALTSLGYNAQGLTSSLQQSLSSASATAQQQSLTSASGATNPPLAFTNAAPVFTNAANQSDLTRQIPPSNIQQQQPFLQQPQAQAMLHQLHFDHSSKPLMPWEVEALQRPPKPQDPNMMPGFSRRSICAIIAHAKAQRMAQGSSTSTPQIYDPVKFPLMANFNATDFVSTRRAYFVATRASIPSCLFKEFKQCMSDKCRVSCMRKFSLDDETWLALADDKLQNWLSVFFGPKSKADAIRRLESVKFPNHSDSHDSQAEFVNKLDECAYDFEATINDIADTHATWVNDPTSLSSGQLDIKEVMEIWKKKFAKQDRSVFSVQIKEVRDFLDRNKDALFNDIILKLSNHFSSLDTMVLEGSMHYSTTPTVAKRATPAGNHQGSRLSSQSRDQSSLGRRPAPATPFDRSGPRSKSEKPAFTAKVTPGHMRGISCGSFTNHWGLGCSTSTCVFAGTKHDMNKGGHVFKDSNLEESVKVDKATYEALLKARPNVTTKWAAAKDQYLKTKFNARVSALAAGEAISDNDDESDNPDLAAAAAEFGPENLMSDTDSAVNDDEYSHASIAALSSCNLDAADLLRIHKMKQFFGVSLICDSAGKQSNIATLMDPGAEYNIVSPAVRDICSISKMPVQVSLFQGKKKQGVVNEIAQCRFELKNFDGTFVKHVEWCTVADLGYDILLGRKFCHDNGFTSFDTLLTEWKQPDGATSSDTVSAAALNSANLQSCRNYVFVKFVRVQPEEGKAKYKRDSKALKCFVPLSDGPNMISSRDIHASNPLSSIKVLDSRKTDSTAEVQLQFHVESAVYCTSATIFVDWFVVDESIKPGTVQMSQCSQASLAIATNGNVRTEPPLLTPASVKYVLDPKPADRQPAVHDSVSASAVSERNRRAVKRERTRTMQPVPISKFEPQRSQDNIGILRFTGDVMATRPAVCVELDNCAAHNVIDENMLSKAKSKGDIVECDRKTRSDIVMVLLEFSLECKDRNHSRTLLREWFRVAKCPPHRQIIVCGLFNNERLETSCRGNRISLSALSSADVSRRELFCKPPRRSALGCQASSVGELDNATEAMKMFEHSAAAALGDDRFVSFHPVSHYRLNRALKPPIPELHHRQRASAKVNVDLYRSASHAAVKSAVAQSQLERQISSSKHKLMSMIRQLPAEFQPAERAAIAALTSSTSDGNFEAAIDKWKADETAARVADSLLIENPESGNTANAWLGNPLLSVGCYAEIEGAVVTTELNGKRVRLYDKTDRQNIWLIRVLGKNSGIWQCHEKFLKNLPIAEQAASRPASSNAGFLDIAIDETGQPTGELPQLAHRQFGSEYSQQLTKQIEQLKCRFPHVFTKDVSEPCAFEKMKIRLIPNAILPSKSRFYRNTPKMKEEVRRQIQEQLDWGAIRKAETPHCSDILLVKRPHMPGQWRFVINFQKLNEATVPEQLIMPDPASQHARLAGCKIFGALDLSSYFRQLQLDESCQFLTGFASDEGTFVHTRVPMGIRNAPSFAQRVLQDALANDPVLGPLGIKNYFDDVPFGAKSEEEFLVVMEAMLNFCSTWKLKVNPE